VEPPVVSEFFTDPLGPLLCERWIEPRAELTLDQDREAVATAAKVGPCPR